MKTTRIRIPKALFGGFLLSLVAFWIAGAVIFEITVHVHSSALATILDYLKLNNNNPAVYGTELYQTNVPTASGADAFVDTPIAMLIAGLVLGLYTRRMSFTRREIVQVGVAMGLIFAVGIIAFNLVETLAIGKLEGGGPTLNPAIFTPAVLLPAVAQIAAYTVMYAMGTILAGILRPKPSVVIARKKAVVGPKTA